MKYVSSSRPALLPIEALTKHIDYRFQNITLLIQALTHRSVDTIHNERLEFLGDAILGNIIAIALFERYPQASEGNMSQMRASLVCESTLVKVATQLHLSNYLRLGTSTLKANLKQYPSLLANAFEALIGAIYLDSNFFTCQRWILSWYHEHFTTFDTIPSKKSPKTQLQEYLHQHRQPLPCYILLEQTGPSHEPVFTIACQVETKQATSTIQQIGIGQTRRQAEQVAAEKMLQLLKKNEKSLC